MFRIQSILLLLFLVFSNQIFSHAQTKKDTKNKRNSVVKESNAIRDYEVSKLTKPLEQNPGIDESKEYFIQTFSGLQNRILSHAVNPSSETDMRVNLKRILGGDNRYWQFKKKEDGKYIIYGKYTVQKKGCLGSDSRFVPCDNRYSQDWDIIMNPDGSYSFRASESGKYLAHTQTTNQLSNNSITLIDNRNEDRAKWVLQPNDLAFTFYLDGQPKNIANACIDNLIRGDREFGGDPNVTVSVKLIPTPSSLNAEIEIKMIRDETQVSKVIKENVLSFTPIRPDGIIGEMISPNVLYFSMDLNGHGEHELLAGRDFPEDSPVRRIILRGDTMGADISDDRDCTDDAELILIEFNPVLLRGYRKM